MKKFISILLCVIVFTGNIIFIPYTSTVYASEILGEVGKCIVFDKIVKCVQSLFSMGYSACITGGSADGAIASKSLDAIWGEDSAINKWLQTKLFPFMDANGNVDLTKPDCPISYDKEKQLVEFNPTFVNEFNEKFQNELYALDGYFMIVPPLSKDSFDASAFLLNARNNVVSKGLTSESNAKSINADYNITKMNNYVSKLSAFNAYISSDEEATIFGYSFDSSDVLYLDGE